MNILIAPNAFKNSLPAGEVAKAIQRGLDRSRLKDAVLLPPSGRPFTGRPNTGSPYSSECFPVGDGGDGTGDLLIERLGGHRVAAGARDPFGRPLTTCWGLISTADSSGPGHLPTAVIEMANASGLRLLDPQELDPLHASSAGTGDLIRAALDHHNALAPDQELKRIIIGMGGSATVDGGTGILQALGARFLNADGQPLHALPGGLTDLASIALLGIWTRDWRQ